MILIMPLIVIRMMELYATVITVRIASLNQEVNVR